jgi:hypothetical protein
MGSRRASGPALLSGSTGGRRARTPVQAIPHLQTVHDQGVIGNMPRVLDRMA